MTSSLWRYNEITPVVFAAPPDPPPIVKIEAKINWTPERIEQEIEDQAKKYGANAEVMKNVIQCESQGSTTIQSLSRNKKGERENSWGLAQIWLTGHKDITKEQAIDPQFAIEYMAKNIVHRPEMWSCWTMKYGSNK